MSGSADEIVDLTGMACPQNAIYALTKIAAAEDGAIVEIIVEGSKQFYSVLGSIQEEGHEIIKIENAGVKWTAKVKKR